MPRLYPSMLEDNDVKMIAEFLATDVFKCKDNPPQSCAPPPAPASHGTEEWRQIYSVLTSPRCLNCHPVSSSLPERGGYPQDYPRQADDRHAHYYGIVRGDVIAFTTEENTGIVLAGIGAPFARCASCHGKKNDPKTGIPGTDDPLTGDPFWFMAPASMAWESAPGVPMTGDKLCASLKDKSRMEIGNPLTC